MIMVDFYCSFSMIKASAMRVLGMTIALAVRVFELNVNHVELTGISEAIKIRLSFERRQCVECMRKDLFSAP